MNTFDPMVYLVEDGEPLISSDIRQLKLGEASRLMTSMMYKDATEDELNRVENYIKVLKASKIENMDYLKASADMGIKELKSKYKEKRR